MRRLLLASALALACQRPAPPPAVTLRTPAAIATPAASAAPPAPVAPGPTLDVVGGDLVDLQTMTAVHRLVPSELVLAHAVGGRAAYAWVRAAAGGEELRAFDTATGARLWSKPVDACGRLAASTEAAFCPSSGGLRRFLRRDGSSAIAGDPTEAYDVVPLGPRVLAVHHGALEALDASGLALGRATTPFDPDFGYERHALLTGGGLACGSRADDAGADVFCADATPKIVWRARLAVSRGVLVQSGDVLVVRSDTWTKTPSSAVVRTADGRLLLQAPGRLGAAVATGGRLDGALSLDPAVTLLDPSGKKLWTWQAPPFPRAALRAAKVGSRLVVALYNPIATGTQLVALDATSGALLWRANVDSVPIAHSKYRNEVALRARGSVVTLAGTESSQEYVQTFDAATGRRLASVLRGR